MIRIGKKTKAKAVEYLRKSIEGEDTTTEESAAYDELIRYEMHHRRQSFLAKLPKGTYSELSGRQRKVINDQAVTYGLPIGGESVDLYEVIRAFHDFIAKHHREISDSGLGEFKSKKMQLDLAMLRHKVEKLDDERAIARGEWLPRKDVKDRLRWLIEKFHAMSEQIGKMAGGDAQRFMNDCLAEMASELESGKLKFD